MSDQLFFEVTEYSFPDFRMRLIPGMKLQVKDFVDGSIHEGIIETIEYQLHGGAVVKYEDAQSARLIMLSDITAAYANTNPRRQ